MTTYGTIPTTSSSSPPLASNLEHDFSRAEQRMEAIFGIHRPWKTMFNFSSFALPSGLYGAVFRIRINLAFFLRNYIEIVILCLLGWFPFSLLAVISTVGLFVCFVRYGPTLVIFGRPIGDLAVLTVMCLLTVVILLLIHTQVMLNFMVAVLVVAAATVATQAAWRKTEDLFSEEEDEEASRSWTRNVDAKGPLWLFILVSCLLLFFFGHTETI